ncbi:hypothetical protein phytr_6000 [Candidatus Phycorickettsia trachydisci]|uniref:Uncharacterized protein n=1 Tax=Candidatus Phycorickettsia trachydisci TaxID=2115978 RepID=A0A2P1P8F1_9RICK|nr:hypothetical protein [Candidatus Phycorickettsia trachydisci]AVP87541.1 hypothetical protein phytr_6000 [Candidatus Phycorickettsia trachydisci]
MQRLLLVICFLLTSCQHNQINSEIRGEMSLIGISAGNSIEASEFYYHLARLLRNNLGQNLKYNLEANLKYDSNILTLSKADDKREVLNHTVHFKLYEQGKVIFEDTIKVHSSSPIYDNPVVSYTASGNAKEFMARRAAELVYHRLLLFFKSSHSL